MYSGWYHVEQINKSRPCLVAGPSVKIVLIDFHTHSTASDGALEPGEIVARALDSGVGLLAITDHDTVAGYLAAAIATPPMKADKPTAAGVWPIAWIRTPALPRLAACSTTKMIVPGLQHWRSEN